MDSLTFMQTVKPRWLATLVVSPAYQNWLWAALRTVPHYISITSDPPMAGVYGHPDGKLPPGQNSSYMVMHNILTFLGEEHAPYAVIDDKGLHTQWFTLEGWKQTETCLLPGNFPEFLSSYDQQDHFRKRWRARQLIRGGVDA